MFAAAAPSAAGAFSAAWDARGFEVWEDQDEPLSPDDLLAELAGHSAMSPIQLDLADGPKTAAEEVEDTDACSRLASPVSPGADNTSPQHASPASKVEASACLEPKLAAAAGTTAAASAVAAPMARREERKGLLAFMDEAVSVMEAASKPEEVRVSIDGVSEDDELKPPTSHTPTPNRRAPGSIVARTDIFDAALKKAGPASDKAPAKASAQGALSGLRTAYSKPQPEVPEEPESPEETGDGGEGKGNLADEWAEVAARTEQLRAKELEAGHKIRNQDDPAAMPVSYREVCEWVWQIQVDPEVMRPYQEETVEDGGCSCLSRSRPLGSVPGLDKRLWKDKDLVLFLKSTHFDFREPMHFRMVRTIYCKLSRNKVCPWIGGHWEILGFQNTDPRMDLNRSGGLLNVIHMFYSFAHYFELLKGAFLLSQDAIQNFPLFCVSINISQMVVDCMLSGKLSSVINSSGTSVFEATCKIHAAGLHYFYSQWKGQKRTIRDTQLTRQEVQALLERRPAKLLEALEKGVQDQRSKSDPTKFEFTDMDFGGNRKPASSAPSAAAAELSSRLKNYCEGEGE